MLASSTRSQGVSLEVALTGRGSGVLKQVLEPDGFFGPIAGSVGVGVGVSLEVILFGRGGPGSR